MENTTQQSPFAAPAAASTPPPTSAPSGEMGDTSFLDDVSSREPLIKGCTVPGSVTTLEVKQSEEGGVWKQSIFIAVQLFGDKMVFENGDPVPPGKRLINTLYLPIDTPEKMDRSERKVKNLLLALNDVPLDGREKEIYKGWPAAKKLGLIRPTAEDPRPPRFSFHALTPGERFVGAKVMVQVTTGKDMDGNPRNEFSLLAASTKPIERKGR